MMVLDNDSLDFNAVDTTNNRYTTVATFGSTGATIGQTGGSHIQISSSGFDVNLNSSTNIANFGINGARIGQTENSSVSITPSSIEMRKAGAVCSRFVLPTTQKTCVYVTKARINLNIDEEVGSTVFLFRHVDLTGKTMVVDFVGPRQHSGEISNTQKTYNPNDEETWFWYTASTGESGTTITVKFNGVSTSGTYTFALRLYVDAISSPCYISCYPDMTDETVMFAVGNGTSNNARSNALTVDWNGNVVQAGGLTIKGTIYGKYLSDNTVRNVLECGNQSGNVVLGYGGYNESIGNTNIYGNKINFLTKNGYSIGSPADFRTALGLTANATRKIPVGQTYSKNVGKIAANTYKNCETNTFTPTTAQSGLYPIVMGWDVQGTGTASCQIMGVYISGNATDGYVGHIKLKNDSSSQIGDVTIVVAVLWV